jgi:kinetochore protein NDC80
MHPLPPSRVVHRAGLGYPFTLSPAALCAVGAPNTWPSMLAAVSWLIELLSYDDVVARDEAAANGGGGTDGGGDSEQADKRFFRFLSSSYTAFLSGADADFEKLSRGMEQCVVIVL